MLELWPPSSSVSASMALVLALSCHRGEMRGRHTLKSSLFGGTNGEWKRPLADQAAVVEEAALWLGWGPQHGRGMRHGEGLYRVHGTTD